MTVMTEPTEIIEHLLSRESVALLMHINPDWDCLGSCMALREVLRGRGVRCDIFADEPLSSYLSYWDADVKIFDGELPYACLCCVDAGDTGRIGKRGETFAKHGDTVCIDHHMGGGNFAGLSCVKPDSPATGEIVYDMLKGAGLEISKKTAEYIYCAVSSDTGSFRYSGTTSHTMSIIGEIMDMGIDTAALADMLYCRKTLRQLKLQGEAISTLALSGGGKICTAYVTAEMYKKYNADKADTEALAAMPREIDGVVMSAFFTQRTPDEIRVSLRSEGDYNIRPVAVKFGGGGHMRASGCTISGSDMEYAVAVVTAELEKLL